MSRVIAVLATALLAAPATAASPSLALADSFRIGSGGVLCTAQSRSADPALTAMFDRGYSLVCRDAAATVGSLYALRVTAAAAPAARLAPLRTGADCDAATAAANRASCGASSNRANWTLRSIGVESSKLVSDLGSL